MRCEIVILVIFPYLSTGVSIKPFNVEDTKNHLYWRRSDAKHCEPFETYVVDCNRCICNADGVPYCTKMACIDMGFFKLKAKRKKLKTSTLSTLNYEIDLNQIQHY